MPEISTRKSLAAAATIVTSAAVAAGVLAPVAHATNPSPDSAPVLTVTSETGSMVTVGVPNFTGYSMPGGEHGGHDLAWAPTGNRFAFVNDANDIILTSVDASSGDHYSITPKNTAGVIRSHPTWIDGGAAVLWSEKATPSSPAVLKYAMANGYDQANGMPAVHDFSVPGMTGSLEFPDAVGDLIAFQATGGTSIPTALPVIMMMDLSQATPSVYAIAIGMHPSISPDGTKVAFVDSGSGSPDQIVTASTAKPNGTATTTAVTANAVPIATNPHPYAHPVWSSDGKSIVFESLDATGTDTDTLSVTIGSTTETQVRPGNPTPGLPAYQPGKKDEIVRLAGADRLGTAIAASRSHWGTAGTPNGAQAKAVVLSRSDQPFDALGGSALAAEVGGPLLLTPTAALNSDVGAEIQRVLGPGSGRTVYVLGGEAAISPAVAKALTTLGYTVTRVGGPDRYATAVQIARQITGGADPDYVMVATGSKTADALSAGAAAGSINAGRDGKRAVVLLTNDAVMPQATADYLTPLTPRTGDPSAAGHVELDSIGGAADLALKSSWPGAATETHRALTGADRYQTSFLVAKTFFGPTGNVGLATGVSWADALSGGALMGTLDGPMLLVDPNLGPSAEAAKWLKQSSGSITQVLIFGGSAAVAPGVTRQVGDLVIARNLWVGYDTPVNPQVG